MQKKWQYSLALLALLALSLAGVATPSAQAQCGGFARKAAYQPRSAPYRGTLGARFTTTAFGEEASALQPIVGLWKVVFTDTSKNYADTAYITYHSDFTEFQNSLRQPSTGAVCQGVWQRTGPSTYRVNHYALAYGDTVNLTNLIRIREEITIDPSGKTFTGTHVTTVYDSGPNHFPLVEFKGPMTGAKVLIDSGVETQ